MMELVVKKLCAILRTEACSIFTVRGKTGYLDYWGNNKKLKELSAKNMFRVKQGIVGQVIAEGKTRVVEDAAINNDVDASIDEQTGFVTECELPVLALRAYLLVSASLCPSLALALDFDFASPCSCSRSLLHAHERACLSYCDLSNIWEQ